MASNVYHARSNDGPTAFCDCVLKLRFPGDECRLHTGKYTVSERCNVSGLIGSSATPFVIASAGDGPVTIDGTVPITGPWHRSTDGFYRAGMYSVVLRPH